MIRDVDIADISDGRFYTASDIVKADTMDCAGCSSCCRTMTDTIFLDPWDIFRMKKVTGMTFGELMEGRITLSVADGLITPVMAMREDGACGFLNEEDRCSIHPDRPGFCRLFPLGRYYEGGDFRYFLQVKECPKPKVKTRVSKWLGIEDLPLYEDYVRSWHAFRQQVMHLLEGTGEDLKKQVNLYILQLFYRRDWDTERSFYEQFEERLIRARHDLSLA